eukprot:3499254-Pyramimonas_sp.AAC.1
MAAPLPELGYSWALGFSQRVAVHISAGLATEEYPRDQALLGYCLPEAIATIHSLRHGKAQSRSGKRTLPIVDSKGVCKSVI